LAHSNQARLGQSGGLSRLKPSQSTYLLHRLKVDWVQKLDGILDTDLWIPLDLLRPYPEEDMKSWRVSDKVGNRLNNWAELIEPVSDDAAKHGKKEKRAKPKKELPPRGLFD
jgi:hypothetical protein